MNYTIYALYAFAAAFVVVGFFRIVEFKSAGISRGQRFFLIPLHIVGTFLFAAAIIFLARDLPAEKMYMKIAFAGGMLILFPMHIYVGIKRRILINKK